MEQVFRIEIPVEAVDNTDVAALQRLETTLTKLFNTMKNSKTGIEGVFDAIETGAVDAKTAMKKVETAFDGVADGLDDAADAAGDVSDAYDDAADAAQGAGRRSGSAFDSATSSADKFTQRMEKSNKSLRNMFKEKLQLTLTAIDRASPILKDVWNSAKSLVGRGWNMVVRMTDFVTAPFRKLWNLISSPITMALSVAGIGMSASDVFNTFTGFEEGMSGVRALTEATDAEFLLLRETAKSLGASTSFSASQAAEGMQNLASAGFTVNEIVAAMPGMLDLAASSGEDLAVASDIAATTLRGFGLEASKAGHVADVLAEVSARTNAAVSDTGEAMKYIAPVANAMGLSLEEVAASIGFLSDAGIKGSQAGTTLRSAFTRLAKPTEDMLEVMDSLNLSFYDTDGKMKSISNIVGMLNTEMAGLTDAEKQNALVTLFGQEALSGMMVLMEAGPEKIAELTKSLEECDGAASKMSQTRLDNLAGDIEELGGAMETLQLDVMEKLNPYLRGAVQWLTGKIPGVQTMLENAIDSGVVKAKELYENVTAVFDSAKFQNADGFAEKFFIAWDELVADPFEKWWSGGGKKQILGKLADLGEGAGEMLNGIVTGIFAAFTGKDIDFEGLNISGLAKAGAEGAKTFISSFVGGLNVGDLFGKAPGIMQAGLLGFGAVKIGSTIGGAVKTLGALKAAFLGTSAAATTGASAMASVGTVLSAIPVWGWVAAAAITAAVIGIKAYTDAQKEQQWALERSSEATAEAIENYKDSARSYVEFTDTLDRVTELQLKIESSDTNPQTAEYVQSMLDDIEDKTAQVEVIMSDSSLTPEQISAYTDELVGIYTRRAEIDIILSGASMSVEEVAAYKSELSGIESRKAEIEAVLSGASMTPEEITGIKNDIAGIQSRKAEIEATIAEGGLSASEISTLQAEYNSLSDREAQLTLTMSGQGLSASEVATLQSEYNQISSREAEIKLALSGQSMSQEELGAMVSELEKINAREAEITAEMSEAGMSEEDISEVVGLLNQIGDKSALINVSLGEGTLSADELTAYNQELQQLYGQVVELSGGTFTQADVDAGRITPERLAAFQEQLRVQAEAELYEATARANADADLVPQTVAARDQAYSRYEAYTASGDMQYDEKAFLQGLEDQRRIALGQYQTGVLDDEGLAQVGLDIREQWKNYYGDYLSPRGNMTGLMPDTLFGEYTGALWWSEWKPADNDFFRNAIAGVNDTQGYSDEQAASYYGDYERQNAALVQNYQNQKGLIEGWTFHGSELAGMSLEEVAASYATLDEAGRKMFDDAVMALNALNQQTDYLTEGEKTQAIDVVDLAAKAEVMQTVQTQVQTIATNYQAMSQEQQATFAASEEGAAQLAAVNEALSSLGLEQIESLDQLNGALETLSSVDLSSFSLAEAQAAFAALGGDADGCKTKVDNLRSALDQLDGKSTSSTHTHTNLTINRTISIAGGRVALNAEGGIYDGAMLSWVAEDGPEAIIPLGSKRRDRGIELWLAAGEMLGVTEFADGGIVAPYAGVLEKLPEDSWDDEGGGDEPKPVHVGGGGGSTGPISVSVAANPVFHIEGGNSSEDILSKIKAHQAEIAEILGGAFADQLEDILTNMA